MSLTKPQPNQQPKIFFFDLLSAKKIVSIAPKKEDGNKSVIFREGGSKKNQMQSRFESWIESLFSLGK